MRLPFSVLVLLTLATSCAAPRAEFTSRPATPVVWPPGDPKPRIELLFSYRGTADSTRERSLWKRVGEWIAGRAQVSIVGPYGMCLAPDGALWVADTSAGAVHRIDLETIEHRRIRGSDKEPFITPVGIAAGPDGRVYVSDSTRARIVVLDSGGDVVGGFGTADEIGRPTGMVFDVTRGRLLVIDTTWNRILSFDPEGRLLAGTGRRGSALGEYNFPTNLALDAAGRIYVVDSLNFRIQVLSPDFEPLRAFGIPGSGPGAFSKPKGIALDSEGHIYVVDALFENVQIFDDEGLLLLNFGGHGTGFGQLTLPTGILIDAQDRIFVADNGNARIQAFQYLARP